MHFYPLDGTLTDEVGTAHGVTIANVSFTTASVAGSAARGSWTAPIDLRPATLPRATVGAWIRAPSSLGSGGGAPTERGFATTPEGRVQAGGVGAARNATGTAIDDGLWHCVAVVYEPQQAILWVDGAAQVLLSSPPSGSAMGVTLDGAFDSVFVFGRALSVAELADACSASARSVGNAGCARTTSLQHQLYLKSANPVSNYFFGQRVALSADGTTLVVGSPGEASASTGINGSQSNDFALFTGAVFVYTRRDAQQWLLEAYIKASNAEASDVFGQAVALDATGNTLVVGAIGEASRATGVDGDQADNSFPEAGAVFVFERDPMSRAWHQAAYVKASNTRRSALFGENVALSRDGRMLAVAAPRDMSTARLVNGDQSNADLFGAGAVYVFEKGAAWTQVW